MPMSGGTRMLRARRKDCNVKPNRRLDRKSSRGMLFENEELRMRTITINAEVEQGQHALKKLRRENEQLRREMWCLRDEYDKMEKLLRKREEGEESDQENSDTDDNLSRTDESDEEKRALKEKLKKEENADLENEESSPKFPQFGSEANVRTFDGLSVIDEQTEETQTTESAVGYGTLSRGNSANRTFNQSGPEEGVPEFQGYGCGVEAQQRKKVPYGFENRPGFPGEWPVGQCDTYEDRPASPYPYNGSYRPSYQKRFQVLQELPLVAQTPANGIGENGWIFPDPSKVPPEMPGYDVYVDDSVNFRENYIPEKPPDPNVCASSFGYSLIQDRGGPDVFVTGGYSQVNNRGGQPDPVHKTEEKVPGGEGGNVIDNVEPEIDKIEISQKSEMDPKIEKMTALTKSALSLMTTIPGGETQETLDPGKLTMDEAVDRNDNGISRHVQRLVTCQNSNGQDVRETVDDAAPTTAARPNSPPPGEMPQQDKQGSSKYQTKLVVTLKTPGPRPEGKAPKKVPGPVPPRTFHPHNLRYGIRPEYSARFQTFPAPGFQPNVRMPSMGSRGDCLVNHFGGVRMGGGGLSGSLPRLPTLPRTDYNPSNIPDDLDRDIDVLPDEESLPVPVTQSLVKPVKIPPVPPPRTSSCPKPIIPAPPVGVTALHQRTFGKGKLLQCHNTPEHPQDPPFYNPLLMSQPIATSSPTISVRGADTFYGSRFRKESYNEDSSLEEFSRQKLKLRDEGSVPKLNKSLSSPSFGSFRTLRRKQSEVLGASMENILAQKIPEAIGHSEKPDKKISKTFQNNASVSSSSGLDSPTKNDRRKRRVSIQFKKKHSQNDGKDESVHGKEANDSRRDSSVQGILSVKIGHKSKGKSEETDATTSERERTNSVSSRTSSVMAGSGNRRKYSISSNRTYLNDEKIPWCGCWGNGCV